MSTFVILLATPSADKLFDAIAESPGSPPYPFDLLVVSGPGIAGTPVLCYFDSELAGLPPSESYWNEILPWLEEVARPLSWDFQEFFGPRPYKVAEYWPGIKIHRQHRIDRELVCPSCKTAIGNNSGNRGSRIVCGHCRDRFTLSATGALAPLPDSSVKCPGCAKSFRVKAKYFGKRVSCGICKTMFRLSDDGLPLSMTRDAARTLVLEEQSTLSDHCDPVLSTHVVTKMGVCLTGDIDKSVKVWSLATGQLIRTIDTGRRVKALCATADGSAVLTSNEHASELTVWDLPTGNKLYAMAVPLYGASSVCLCNSDTRAIATQGGLGSSVYVFDLRGRRILATIEGSHNYLESIACTDDGSLVVTGGRDRYDRGGIQLIDLRSGDVVREFKGHSSEVRSVYFIARGDGIVTGSKDGTVKRWDTTSGKCVWTQEHPDEVNSICVSSVSNTIFSAASDGAIRGLDLNTGEILVTAKAHKGGCFAIAISSDGTHVVSGGRDTQARIWRVKV